MYYRFLTGVRKVRSRRFCRVSRRQKRKRQFWSGNPKEKGTRSIKGGLPPFSSSLLHLSTHFTTHLNHQHRQPTLTFAFSFITSIILTTFSLSQAPLQLQEDASAQWSSCRLPHISPYLGWTLPGLLSSHSCLHGMSILLIVIDLTLTNITSQPHSTILELDINLFPLGTWWSFVLPFTVSAHTLALRWTRCSSPPTSP